MTKQYLKPLALALAVSAALALSACGKQEPAKPGAGPRRGQHHGGHRRSGQEHFRRQRTG